MKGAAALQSSTTTVQAHMLSGGCFPAVTHAQMRHEQACCPGAADGGVLAIEHYLATTLDLVGLQVKIIPAIGAGQQGRQRGGHACLPTGTYNLQLQVIVCRYGGDPCSSQTT